ALPASLATTTGIITYFLFLQVLRCFSSLGSPHDKSWYCIFNAVGCPIRTSADQSVFASPRSFSQLITSFIASESQGIPHTPLSTFSVLLLLSLSLSLTSLLHHVKELLISLQLNHPPERLFQ